MEVAGLELRRAPEPTPRLVWRNAMARDGDTDAVRLRSRTCKTGLELRVSCAQELIGVAHVHSGYLTRCVRVTDPVMAVDLNRVRKNSVAGKSPA